MNAPIKSLIDVQLMVRPLITKKLGELVQARRVRMRSEFPGGSVFDMRVKVDVPAPEADALQAAATAATEMAFVDGTPSGVEWAFNNAFDNAMENAA